MKVKDFFVIEYDVDVDGQGAIGNSREHMVADAAQKVVGH